MSLDHPDMQVRPSAHLALSVHLPGMDLSREVPLGFGFSRRPLAPGAGLQAPASDVLTFFAGRFRLDLDQETDESRLLNAIQSRIEAALRDGGLGLPGPDGVRIAVPSGATGFVRVNQRPQGEAGQIQILGEPYRIRFLGAQLAGYPSALPALEGPEAAALVAEAVCPEGSTGACEAAAEAWVAEVTQAAREATAASLDEVTHWIPYAFGAVPITATGDIISHGAHGLVGVIDVLPADWPAPATADFPSTTLPLGDGGGSVEQRVATHVPGGHGLPFVHETLTSDGPETVREFVLFYQDGLNLWDDGSAVVWRRGNGTALATDFDGAPVRAVPDCPVCDDSYDRGDHGVSFRSAAFADMLRRQTGANVEAHDDLNQLVFPDTFFAAEPEALRLTACEGERIVIRVVHPGGRARQRTFAMNGYTYDDLFPGFGFPRSVLLAPGKSITAWLEPVARPGVTIWHDGPTPIRAGGVWGLIDVAPAGDARCTG